MCLHLNLCNLSSISNSGMSSECTCALVCVCIMSAAHVHWFVCCVYNKCCTCQIPRQSQRCRRASMKELGPWRSSAPGYAALASSRRVTASWCTGKTGALKLLSSQITTLSKHRDCIMVHGENRRTDLLSGRRTALSKHRDCIMVHGKHRRTDITIRSSYSLKQAS